MRRCTVITVVLALLLAMPAAAWAYVDPAAGSIFLQLLLGGVAGVLIALKLTYRQILGWFGRRPPELPTTEGQSDPPR